ncbi:hypothetical protein B7P33_13355 [Sediminicola luteus]|uniref:Uncharacterized protein n=1 Tax=Sediminicola luteus TaxID=319238 RepID=A0A2A4G453_9FLAO|nr:hypothetical protein B7P33_13355 [Sediminicola luteus]
MASGPGIPDSGSGGVAVSPQAFRGNRSGFLVLLVLLGPVLVTNRLWAEDYERSTRPAVGREPQKSNIILERCNRWAL